MEHGYPSSQLVNCVVLCFVCVNMYCSAATVSQTNCSLKKRKFIYIYIYYAHIFSCVELYIYILQSDVFIYRRLCINIRLYFIVRCFHLQKSMYQYKSRFYSKIFSSIEVYVSIYDQILQSDVSIYRSLCINIRLDVSIYRSLCINIRLDFIVRCFHLQKSMYQYTSIFYSQMFSSIEVYVSMYVYILQSDVFIYRSLCINVRLYFIVRYFHIQKSVYLYTSIFYRHVFIYRSLCINIRLHFIVRCFLLQKSMY